LLLVPNQFGFKFLMIIVILELCKSIIIRFKNLVVLTAIARLMHFPSPIAMQKTKLFTSWWSTLLESTPGNESGRVCACSRLV